MTLPLVASLERAARQLPMMADDLSLADLDAVARCVMRLEATVVAELRHRERAIDKEAAVATARSIARQRERTRA